MGKEELSVSGAQLRLDKAMAASITRLWRFAIAIAVAVVVNSAAIVWMVQR